MYSKVAALSLAAGVASALPAPEAAAGSFNIDISGRSAYQPRADGSADGALFLHSLNNTLKKYGAAALPTYPGLTSLLGKRGTASEPLTDQVESGQDELYYGPIGIGSQSFTVDFDTGSADLFVPGPSCSGCSGTTRYNQMGTNEHRTASVTYGSGSVSGPLYADTVSFGGLAAKNCTLISSTQESGFSSSNSEGLMGMGFSTISSSGSPTYFEQLMAQGGATSPEFAFFLGRAASNTQSLSELTVGGRDTNKYTGAVTSVPVSKKGYWQVALDGLNANNKAVGGTAGQAAIDTGTTIVLTPNSALLALVAAIPGAVPLPLASGSPEITLFAYPCASNPKVAITFAGKQFAINPLDLNGGQLSGLQAFLPSLVGPLIGGASGAYCVANVAGADITGQPNFYIVGDTFLKNWYSIYNYVGSASVNFAAAKGNQ